VPPICPQESGDGLLSGGAFSKVAPIASKCDDGAPIRRDQSIAWTRIQVTKCQPSQPRKYSHPAIANSTAIAPPTSKKLPQTLDEYCLALLAGNMCFIRLESLITGLGCFRVRKMYKRRVGQ